LLDRDGRRQAVDLVDVGLLHHLQELPRIGRQRFDVAPLAFGIDGVEASDDLPEPDSPVNTPAGRAEFPDRRF